MIRVLTTCAMLFASGPALALSCMRMDAARTYQEIKADTATYVGVLGTLDFDASKAPPSEVQVQSDAKPDNRIPARLTGHALSANGFDFPWDKDIILNLQCFGPWCTGLKPGPEILAFVRRDGDRYELTLTPCGGHGFVQPGKEVINTILSCHKGGACEPAHGR